MSVVTLPRDNDILSNVTNIVLYFYYTHFPPGGISQNDGGERIGKGKKKVRIHIG